MDSPQPQQPAQPLTQPIGQPQQTMSSPVAPSVADPGKPAKPTDGTGVMAQVLKALKVPTFGKKKTPEPQPISIGSPEMEPVNHTAPIEAGPAMPAEIEIIPETPEVSAEVAEHVEAVERGEIQLPEPIVTPPPAGGPTPGAVPTVASIPNIILPVTRDDFQAGAKKPVSTSWRWLVEWVHWIIKKHPGKVLYRT